MRTGWNLAAAEESAKPNLKTGACATPSSLAWRPVHTRPACERGQQGLYSCLHARPVWDDVSPGGEVMASSKLYSLHDWPNKLIARWHRDFWQE